MHPQIVRGDLKAAARARGRLFEYERDVLALEFIVRYIHLLLHFQFRRQIEQGTNFFIRQIKQFQEASAFHGIHHFLIRIFNHKYNTAALGLQ